MVKEELGENVPITGAKFKEVCNETYYPKVIKDHREKGIHRFGSRALSVEQYAAKFMELSHFALHLIANEGKRVKKCQRGLNDKICYFIVASWIDSYTETVRRGMAWEEDFRRRDVLKETKKWRFEAKDGQGKE